MYELKQAGPRTYYVDCRTQVGIYNPHGNDIWLIDSGFDDKTAECITHHMEEKGWNLLGIILTHSHVDHTANCSYFVHKYGCKVFIPEMEDVLLEHPVLAMASFVGAFPDRKVLSHTVKPDYELHLYSDPDFPADIKVFPLRGHTFNMFGVLTPDGTAYIGDSIFSERTLRRHPLCYIMDVRSFLETLEMLKNMDAAFVVPSHVPPVDDFGALCDINAERVNTVCRHIEEICRGGAVYDEIVKQLFEIMGVEMTPKDYMFLSGTIKSYLSYLTDENRVLPKARDGYLVWETAENG